MKTIFPENMMKSTELSLEGIASRLVWFELQLHLVHWQTTGYASHMAIGSLYEYIHDFTDSCIEKLMGYAGRRINVFKLDPISVVPPEGVIDDLMSFASDLKAFGDRNGYHDIGNLADSLSGEASKTKYLLTLS